MKTCLVVDDSRVIRTIARRMLEELSFDVREAVNGQEAMDTCRDEMPDVILLDWNMPVMSGIDFLRLLRESDGGDEPVVGRTNADDATASATANATATATATAIHWQVKGHTAQRAARAAADSEDACEGGVGLCMRALAREPDRALGQPDESDQADNRCG